MSVEEIREISNHKSNGVRLFDIEAHSLDHQVLSKKYKETDKEFQSRVKRDIKESKEKIMKITGQHPKIFSLPEGTRGHGWKNKEEYLLITRLLKEESYIGLQSGKYFTSDPWNISGISVHNIYLNNLELEFILNRGKDSNYILDFLIWWTTIINRITFKVFN